MRTQRAAQLSTFLRVSGPFDAIETNTGVAGASTHTRLPP